MTYKLVFSCVYGERYIAMWTFFDMMTIRTQKKRMGSTFIEIEEYFFSRYQRFLNFVRKRRRQETMLSKKVASDIDEKIIFHGDGYFW